MDLVQEIVRQAKPRKDGLRGHRGPCSGADQQQGRDPQAARVRRLGHAVLGPFSTAYGLDMLEDVLVIDIRAGTVDLYRMHGAMPEESDQITMNTAGDFVDEEPGKEIAAAFPEAQFTKQMVKQIKERFSTVDVATEPVVVQRRSTASRRTSTSPSRCARPASASFRRSSRGSAACRLPTRSSRS